MLIRSPSARHTTQCGHRRCRARRKVRLADVGSRCPVCGKGKLNPTGKYLRRWNSAQPTCHCGLVPWPHRQGSLEECEHHPEFDPWGQ